MASNVPCCYMRQNVTCCVMMMIYDMTKKADLLSAFL